MYKRDSDNILPVRTVYSYTIYLWELLSIALDNHAFHRLLLNKYTVCAWVNNNYFLLSKQLSIFLTGTLLSEFHQAHHDDVSLSKFTKTNSMGETIAWITSTVAKTINCPFFAVIYYMLYS